MSHMTSKTYYDLQKRLNENVQGAPASKYLKKILETIFTEEEARFITLLPLGVFTAKEASELWDVSITKARRILNRLADKGTMIDLKSKKKHAYFLAQPLAGFFEMTMYGGERYDEDKLANNFYDYMNKEHRFMKELFKPYPKSGRVFVQEPALHDQKASEIYNYEKMSEVIDNATNIGVGICYCRHKMEHIGKKCIHEQHNCLTFNEVALTLIEHNIAKKISKKQAKKILKESIEAGLVQFGESVQNNVAFVCNCCGCCCEGLLAYKKLGHKGIAHSNYHAKVDSNLCAKCGVCESRCPVDAISIDNGKIKVNKHVCIGCGVCTRFCPKDAIHMQRHSPEFIPKDDFERIVLQAIDAGKLQNYIFDNHKLWTHKILRRLTSVILGLPATKRLLFNRQIESIYFKMARKTKKVQMFEEFFLNGKKVDCSHPEMEK
ncbi:4Fe-4S binding protein [Candidatus Woesearchaeota archaeon]|nr:4Fe-4S binding protein [Candidatus Woesearchaeota archaeon]